MGVNVAGNGVFFFCVFLKERLRENDGDKQACIGSAVRARYRDLWRNDVAIAGMNQCASCNCCWADEEPPPQQYGGKYISRPPVL